MHASDRRNTPLMTIPPKTEAHREAEIAVTLEQSALAQEEAASVIDDVVTRLNRLSAEMRKHGAFPIAGQLERERQRRERRADADDTR